MNKYEDLGKYISMLYRYSNKFIDENLKECGIGYGQVPILIELYRNQCQSQDNIANSLGIDKSTIARTIKKLEDMEYIRRVKNPEDNRAYIIMLTDKGISIKERVINVLMDWFNILCNNMNSEENNQVFKILDILSVNAMSWLDSQSSRNS